MQTGQIGHKYNDVFRKSYANVLNSYQHILVEEDFCVICIAFTAMGIFKYLI